MDSEHMSKNDRNYWEENRWVAKSIQVICGMTLSWYANWLEVWTSTDTSNYLIINTCILSKRSWHKPNLVYKKFNILAHVSKLYFSVYLLELFLLKLDVSPSQARALIINSYDLKSQL